MTVPDNQTDKKSSADGRIVEIFREPVELYKVLKFEGMATSGGEAKAVVAAGQVLVNGVTETQKRKQVVSGDTVEYNGVKICLKLVQPVPEDGDKE
jgi:ribosome-associated protein